MEYFLEVSKLEYKNGMWSVQSELNYFRLFVVKQLKWLNSFKTTLETIYTVVFLRKGHMSCMKQALNDN